MNPRERILAVLNREPVDRMPVDLWHTPEIESALKAHFKVRDDFAMWRALGLDKIVWVFMEYRADEGENRGSQVGAQAAGSRTMWGVPLKEIRAGEAVYQEFVEPPLAGCEKPSDLERYPFWPDPERFDYEAADRLARRAAKEFAVIGPWVSFFEIYCQLRGFERALMDLAVNPAFLEAALDRIEEIQTGMMRRFFQRSADVLDMTFISDDIGGQNGLLLSPQMWRTHLEPRMKRWCELIHSHDLKAFYHSDGGFEPLINPLIECGIDILNPVQHACPGMEMANLKKKFGERIIFHGGIDNQSILPFGSVAQVRTEAGRCLETLGKGGRGYICCSCHNVQPGTPLENILGLIEAVKRWRA